MKVNTKAAIGGAARTCACSADTSERLQLWMASRSPSSCSARIRRSTVAVCFAESSAATPPPQGQHRSRCRDASRVTPTPSGRVGAGWCRTRTQRARLTSPKTLKGIRGHRITV
eukprot:7380706-Pyramimonas_sp.AAC.2